MEPTPSARRVRGRRPGERDLDESELPEAIEATLEAGQDIDALFEDDPA